MHRLFQNALTIEIPDEAAHRIRDAAQARGQDVNSYAVAVLLESAEADSEAAGSGYAEYPGYSEAEAIAAIQEGIEDAEAGRYITFEAWRAQIDAEDSAAAAAVRKVAAWPSLQTKVFCLSTQSA